MISGRYRALAWASCVGMFIVLIAGSTVTTTESQLGCGHDFPLCNGKFVPAHTFESLVEYSHRFITGIVGLLIVATFIATLRLYRKHREAVMYATASLVLTIIQAVMGALAVVYSQSPPVLALHFGISLLAVASTALLVVWVRRMDRGYAQRAGEPVPRFIYNFVLFIAVYCYVVVYLGAFIRHTDSGGGCLGWPLCNGEFVPEINGATGIVFLHRIAGLLLFILIAMFYLIMKRVHSGRTSMRASAKWALVLVIVQILSGALLTATIGDEKKFVFTSLLHNVIVTGLFSVILDMGIQAWRTRGGRLGS
ncbi:COX15/CtaA family protein [Paenibacillus beijingensis]|uniref:Cytochrome Caa3 oxidase n=1 Tax=Paenibacillus beijingensis TaxID=1126833 RepID=A0A0D5NL80_9BACL|nr:COX15/CtaA family protein [Paenibacillus beijingensis]AJY75752.1 cytochrome Caa3 oxidase [Paenibacillus beijingensis]